MRKRLLIPAAALAALVAAPSAGADDVPFALAPLSSAPSSLADIMAGVQMRHIKVWMAVKSRNFDLFRFEAQKLAESLVAAAILYRNIPVDYVTAAAKPLLELAAASASSDAAKLDAEVAKLTDACNACNACYTAADVPFIAIKTPSASPFSDQNFAPGEN